MPSYFTEAKLFNPELEYQLLLEKVFEDDVSANIELAAFLQMCNASGNRGRYNAKVEGCKIIAT